MTAPASPHLSIQLRIGAYEIAGALAGLTPDELVAFGRDLIATLCNFGSANEAAAFAAGVAEAAGLTKSPGVSLTPSVEEDQQTREGT